MPKTFYPIIATILLYASCQDTGNDKISLKSSHQKKTVLLKGADAGLQNMTAMLESAFYHTQCSNTPQPGTSPLLQWEQAAKTDSTFNLFYSSLTAVAAAHSCLQNGTCQLVDETNAHILAYTAKNDKEELLVILNFDEDNRAVKAEYQFMDMPLLLSNYDNGAMPVLTSSLLLRPYEVRIYQVN
jgi:hypothetical protein